MIDIEKDTSKAGAYILYNGYFLFMFGFNEDKTNLGVVRFGGKREIRETVIECVRREIKEESSLDIEFYQTDFTYLEDNGKIKLNEKCNPIFVRKGVDGKLSIMYLTYGKGVLKPRMETQGILLLRRTDIDNICTKNLTFKEYIETGGKYILSDILLPENYHLIPLVQLQFLNELFDFEPALMRDYIKTPEN